MSWVAFSLSYAGVALVASAMTVHHRTVFGRSPVTNHVRWLRLAGGVLGIGALPAAVAALGWQVGFVTWCAMLMVSGFVVTQLLAFAPRRAFWPIGALVVPALIGWVFS